VEQIDEADLLYRRIFSYYLKDDGTISSAAFKLRSRKPDPDCSVHLARLTTADAVLAEGLPNQLAVLLLAAVPLGLG